MQNLNSNLTIVLALFAFVLTILAAAWLNARSGERIIEQLDKRFSERLAEMDKRLDARFATLDAKFEIINNRFAAVEARLDRIERQLEAIFKPSFPSR